MNTCTSKYHPEESFFCWRPRRSQRVVAAVAAVLGWVSLSSAQAAQYSVSVLVDTEAEFSGVWSARVGYFDGNRQDEPGRALIHGVIPGSTFELVLSNPFHGVSVRLYDDILTTGAAVSFDGVWYGEGWGAGSEEVAGFDYGVGADYTFGGFNEPNEPLGTPTDSMWGYWDGTFSIRNVGLGSPVPEPGSGTCVLGLSLGLLAARRRKP